MGAIQVGQGIVLGLRLRPLNPALDLAHRVQVLVHPGAVAGAQLALQPRDVVAHPVEQARAASQGGAPLGRGAALAEQALEHHPRMGLGRQRRGGRRPREVVLVDAGIAVVALTDHVEQVHRQLERGQLRLLPDLPGRDLVDGGAQVVVGALGPLRLGRAEERGVRRGVGPGVRVPELEIADHRQLVLHRRQRSQARRELRQLSRRRAGSTSRCWNPSVCKRIRAAGPAGPRCWRSPSSTAPSHRAAAAPRWLRRRAGTSAAATLSSKSS